MNYRNVAPFVTCPSSRRTSLGSADLSRLRKLEEEQEHLNNSLMALTTHFAQVWRSLHQCNLFQI